MSAPTTLNEDNNKTGYPLSGGIQATPASPLQTQTQIYAGNATQELARLTQLTQEQAAQIQDLRAQVAHFQTVCEDKERKYQDLLAILRLSVTPGSHASLNPQNYISWPAPQPVQPYQVTAPTLAPTPDRTDSVK